MTDSHARIRAHYARATAPFETFWAPVLDELTRPLLREMAITAGMRALEIGCGVGVLCGRLAAAVGPGGLVVGGDLVPEMLARTRARLPGLPLIRLDAARLPLRDNAFDAIFCAFALHHVREQRRALADAFRSLAPGGLFGLVTWSDHEADCPAFDAWEELLGAFGAPPDDPAPPPVWLDGIDTPEKVERLLAESGFDEIRAWREACLHAWTAGTLAGYKSGIGPSRRRLDTLPAERQTALQARAAERLAGLRPEDFIWRPEVICAVARRQAGAKKCATSSRASWKSEW